MAARKKRPPRIVAVTTDEAMRRHVEDVLGATCRLEHHDDPDVVLDLLAREPVDGLVADGDLADWKAMALAKAFLRHQAAGRAVLLCGSPGDATLVHLAQRDRRVEIIFKPWEASVIRASLFPGAEPGAEG